MQSHRIHIKGSAEHLEDATHCQLHVKWLPIVYPIDKPPHHEDRTIIASIKKNVFKFSSVFFPLHVQGHLNIPLSFCHMVLTLCVILATNLYIPVQQHSI